MKKTPLIFGIISLMIAVIIFVFGSGLRVVYSGGFFTILGIILIIGVLRKDKNSGN